MTNKEYALDWSGLVPDDEFTVKGERGKFKFLRAVLDAITKEILWIDCFGGANGRQKYRSFIPERVIVPTTRSLQKQRAARQMMEEKGQ